MNKEEIIETIDKIKRELVRKFGKINFELLGVRDIEEFETLPGWAKSRIRDKNGSVEIDSGGYKHKILIIKLQDPFTDRIPNMTAFAIYFSYQASKPIVPSQLKFKLNTLYKVVNQLRKKGYHTFPAIIAFAFSRGAAEILRKHKVEFFSDSVGLLSWISTKLINRLKKIVEIAKFTWKFDKIFVFLKTVIEGLGFEVPTKLIEDWVSKPMYPT